MSLAEYKGGLIVKDGKLCTSCCGDTFCCVYQYAIIGTVFGNTAEEAIQAAYDSAVSNVENLYPGQAEPTWGYQKSDGTWTQEAGYDSRFDRYFTNPMWIWNTSSPLYEAPECLPSSDEKCTAPFAFPKDGDCSTDCPDITPPVDPTGKCCVYTGYQVDFGCGQTSDEAKEDAEEIARGYPGSFIGEPVADPGNEDCAYICPVYVWDSNGGSIDCYDEDKNGNPVTKEFCDSLKTEDVKAAEFTEGEDCGEASIGGRGTCSETPPSENRSNPLP